MKLDELMLEGVNDPAIFKVVFVIGGPGSGKSYITGKLGLGAMGFVPINSDHAFEYLMRKHGVDPKMPPEEKERRDAVRSRAKEITANKSELAIDGRLGIVIDGTGDDYEKIEKLKRNFDQLGYNNFLVVVNTKLEVARQRNQQRARTVPDDIVVQSWHDVQNNIGKFAQIFENVAIIDNSGTDPESTEEQIIKTYTKLQAFARAEPNKPAARRWMERQSLIKESPGMVAELGKSSTYKPVGIMELVKFMELATPAEKKDFNELKASGDFMEAWRLVERVTGVELVEAEAWTKASVEIRKSLKNAGYRLLGSGADATVWAKNKGEVVKIIMPDDGRGAGAAGDTFMKFYQFCLENSGLVNLPRFIGSEVDAFEADGKDYIMATMERLKPIPDGSFQQAVVWWFSDWAAAGVPWSKVYAKITDEELWASSADTFDPGAMKAAVSALRPKDWLELEVLYKLMVLLWHRGYINKVGWDLHTGNAMLRGSTIVLVDPWFQRKMENQG